MSKKESQKVKGVEQEKAVEETTNDKLGENEQDQDNEKVKDIDEQVKRVAEDVKNEIQETIKELNVKVEFLINVKYKNRPRKIGDIILVTPEEFEEFKNKGICKEVK